MGSFFYILTLCFFYQGLIINKFLVFEENRKLDKILIYQDSPEVSGEKPLSEIPVKKTKPKTAKPDPSGNLVLGLCF